ncbi:hypothetical protein [Rathayibacter sp. Leaf248]|uniref:hypothetical protein n=1 Tax=Rathayibacter sp. Leaf248 TaxID=2876555 RepID=UPI001E3341CB|nr:hypothetical protein [Rathayibacter sp. Leaf248]
MTDIPVVVADTVDEIPATLAPGDLVLTMSTGAFGHISGGEPPLRKLASVDAIPEDAAVGDLFLVGTQVYEVSGTPPVTVTPPTMAAPTVTYTTITFSWFGATGSIDGYLLVIDNQPAIEVDGSSYELATAPGSTHTGYVIAKGSDGTFSQPSAPVTASTLRDGAAPTIVPGMPQAGELVGPMVAFRFDVSDSESGVAAASIYWGETPIEAASPLGGDLWGVDIDLERLRAIGLLSYRIRAVDWTGNVSWSEPIEVSIAPVVGDDITPPVVVIVEPNEGTVVPDFLRVTASAYDASSPVSSVEVRDADSKRLIVAMEPLNPGGGWFVDIPRDTLLAAITGDDYTLQFVVRATDSRGNWADSAPRAIFITAPAETYTGTITLLLPPGGYVDATKQKVSNGRYSISQRVTFPNQDRIVTRAPTVLRIERGRWLLGNEEVSEVTLEIPPGSAGFHTELDIPGATSEEGLYRLPPVIPDDRRVAVTDLVRSGEVGAKDLTFLPSAQDAIDARDAARAYRDQARDAAEQAASGGFTVRRDLDGFLTITIGATS